MARGVGGFRQGCDLEAVTGPITTHTQTKEQFRVFNQAAVHVVGLLKESPREPQVQNETQDLLALRYLC